jgi:hypothetical protein
VTTQELEYLVKVNDRDLNELKGRVRDTNKALGADVEEASRRGERGMGRLGKAAGLAALGFAGAGIASLAGAAKVGFDEFREGQQVAAQTEAVIKSTGGAAGVTADHVSKLSGALLRKSGVDDEVIQSGENMLLTFTNVRNEVGKGNDIFDQATRTITDMSVALGQDTKSSAIQLGKALNDPIKGVTALQRVGVTFTKGQKDQIATLVKHGQTVKAQKLILGELNKEFGGSAEAAGKTFGGQISVLKETFNNLAGEAVGHLIPTLQGLLNVIIRHLPVVEQFAGSITGRVSPVLHELWAFIKANVIPIVDDLRQIFQSAVTRIVGVLEQNKPALTEIWRNITTLLKSIANVLEATVIPILRFALTEVLPKAIAIALPVLAKLTESFRIVAAITNAAADAADAVKGGLGAIASFVSGAWGKVESALARPIRVVSGVFSGFAQILQDIWNLLGSLAGAADRAASAIDKVSSIAGKIKGIASHIPGFAEGVTNYGGGLAIVGERGPELVNLPRGSDVIPNHRLAPALSRLAGSSSARVAGLFEGATFIVRDELDALAVGAAVSGKLATLAG